MDDLQGLYIIILLFVNMFCNMRSQALQKMFVNKLWETRSQVLQHMKPSSSSFLFTCLYTNRFFQKILVSHVAKLVIFFSRMLGFSFCNTSILTVFSRMLGFLFLKVCLQTVFGELGFTCCKTCLQTTKYLYKGPADHPFLSVFTYHSQR